MINPLVKCDFYKTGHIEQYPPGTNLVYSNFTARQSRLQGIDHTVWFGLLRYLKQLNAQWAPFFASRKLAEEMAAEYADICRGALGVEISTAPFLRLQELGYLPIKIKSLPEGTRTPIRVPTMVMWNTKPEFYWLCQFIESDFSNSIWRAQTAATIAREYRLLFNAALDASGADKSFAQFMAHDFSYRGMSGYEDALMSGLGHLTAFSGTDTIPALREVNRLYGKPAAGSWGYSVPATEHSVMCVGGEMNEFETFRRLITETYPKGVLSIVSDTWNLWRVLHDYLPRLRNEILGREGKVVIRPDSGVPELILCGDEASPDPYERAGVIKALAEHFGATERPNGFRTINTHVGAIYGDSITIQRARTIVGRMLADKYCPSTVVYGVGSFTYCHTTRDTFGHALKATYAEVNHEPREIFKDPVTDDGMKRSAKGIVAVTEDLQLVEGQPHLESSGILQTVYEDGRIDEGTLVGPEGFASIRQRTGLWS